MTSALVVYLPLKVSVRRRTVIWLWGEADLLSSQYETRYFRKLFHITAVSWWLHYKAIYSAAAADLRAGCFLLKLVSWAAIYKLMQFPLAPYGNIHRDFTRPCPWACRRAQWVTLTQYHTITSQPCYQSLVLPLQEAISWCACITRRLGWPGVITVPTGANSCQLLKPSLTIHVTVHFACRFLPPWALLLKVRLGY